ncbi:pre-rrna-processing protein pno1 [Phaffia rhodozyma]|uniref:Pre-rRNA-processing protein PNO1 n=1 Tax=Phaffia rhodozyma TaxID=264483 RepID=A0A0F7STM2_PHARH|nr:pre-rrna-processing protein pno1 [Phaffia rhodozyma]
MSSQAGPSSSSSKPQFISTSREDEEMDSDDEVMLDSTALPSTSASGTNTPAEGSVEDPSLPSFKPLPAHAQVISKKDEFRRIPIPGHRMTPLKKEWINIYTPLVEMAGLQVRMNVKRKSVEIKTSKHTDDVGQIQKGADFIKAFTLGFDVADAIALLRMDDLYIDTFEIKDVKTLHGDHLSRAIGRIAGHAGKTRFTIENASRTRIVLADTKIHILGNVQNIKIARDAIVSLILGSPPGKVYAGLRTVGSRMRERF